MTTDARDLATPPDSTDVVLDIDDLASRCMGKLELVERILTNLTPTLASEMDELQRVLLVEDRELTTTLSHRIKGTAANVGAKRMQHTACRLESLARQDAAWTELSEQFELLSVEHRRLSDEVARRRS